MEEKLLHYIWQNQCFTTTSLLTSNQLQLQVLSPGIYNKNAGPDFENVKLILDNIVWHGNVEVHVFSSQWKEHLHDVDQAYNNVILHVVWKEDKIVFNQSGEKIPTLELKNFVDVSLLNRYHDLMQEKSRILCENLSSSIPSVYKTSAIETASIHKLQRRASEINQLLKKNAGDWEQTTVMWLAQALGKPINAEGMLQLTEKIHHTMLKKYGNDLFKIEAILFGLAGFLDEDAKDDYHKELQFEFHYLVNKHQLQNQKLLLHQWKFLRLRPASFPTIKIAHLASILAQSKSLLALLLDVEEAEDLEQFLCPPLSSYWQNHYRFGALTKRVIKPGTQTFLSLLINGIIPLMFCYGHHIKDESLYDKAINWLQGIPSENNHIIKNWVEAGWQANNAFESQGLIELKKYWCDKKACLDCTAGQYLLR